MKIENEEVIKQRMPDSRDFLARCRKGHCSNHDVIDNHDDEWRMANDEC